MSTLLWFSLTRPRETSSAETALAPRGGSRRRVARRPAPSGCGSRWSWPPGWEIHKVNEIKISYASTFLHLWYLAVSDVVPLLPDVDQRGGDAEGNLVGKLLGDPKIKLNFFSTVCFAFRKFPVPLFLHQDLADLPYPPPPAEVHILSRRHERNLSLVEEAYKKSTLEIYFHPPQALRLPTPPSSCSMAEAAAAARASPPPLFHWRDRRRCPP